MPSNHIKVKFRLFAAFYKSTLTLSICFSVVFAIIAWPAFMRFFGVAFMSGGTVISLMYKEISQQKEYYFYYNRGISKIMLLISCAALNVLFGTIIFLLQPHA